MPSLPSTIEALIFGNKRQIAGIIPDVTLEEKHVDEIEISDHPIEMGSSISDHAYKLPEQVTIKFGWTDSSNILNSLLSGSIFSGLQSLEDIYKSLLALQSSMVPFDLGTGKRTYTDMLIKSLSVVTDVNSEAALTCIATFRHVNRVMTQTITLDADQQADPAATASVSNSGERQLQDTNSAPSWTSQ